MNLDKSFLKIFAEEAPEENGDILSFERSRRSFSRGDEGPTLSDELVYFDAHQQDAEAKRRPSERFRAALKKNASDRSPLTPALPFLFAQDEQDYLNTKNLNFSLTSYPSGDDAEEDEEEPETELKIFSETDVPSEEESRRENIFRIEESQTDRASASQAIPYPDEEPTPSSAETIAPVDSDNPTETDETEEPDEPDEPDEPAKPSDSAFYSALERSVITRRIERWPELSRQLYDAGRAEFVAVAEVVEERLLDGRRIIGFGGNGPLAGTSTLLLGLVCELIGRGFSLLLVDADFQNPSLSEQFGLSLERGWEQLADFPKEGPESGLVRVLLDESALCSPAELHLASEESVSFFFLPLVAKKIAASVAASCKRSHLSRILELAEMFDLVLIDHGSFDLGSGREKIAELLRFGDDGYFLIGDARADRQTAEREWIAETSRRHIPCLGVIENYAR